MCVCMYACMYVCRYVCMCSYEYDNILQNIEYRPAGMIHTLPCSRLSSEASCTFWQSRAYSRGLNDYLYTILEVPYYDAQKPCSNY